MHESFHFVLNNVLIADNRIPPYGFRYDDAETRNVLPVPATQYGSPGSGGLYQHFDTVALDPPPGAVSADIELLYQPTSWEYIQFLYRANDGSVAFLADTGEHMLEAWQALGMAEPVVMASTTWTGAPDPWVDLGFALAGTQGDPLLVGSGSLVADTPLSIALSSARAGAFAHLVVGYNAVNLPFYGGTLVPDISPPGFFVTLFTDGAGSLTLNETWPPGVPSGFELYLQYWIDDPATPAGLAASNAVVGTTP